MHDLEAEAQQILSEFQRRRSCKRLEQQKGQTPEASKADTMEAFEKELSELYGLPVKINTKSQATMYYAMEFPKPDDRGGRGVKSKRLPSYMNRKWLQQCRYILRHSESLTIDVIAGRKSIPEALRRIRHNRTPEIVAIHEAGHAVIARILGLVCGGASIVGDDKGTAGISQSGWIDNDNRKRPQRYGRDAEAMVCMAGHEAEIELLGKACNGDGSDREEILMLLARPKAPCEPHTDYEKTEARLRKMTRMLVRRHRAKIELIAEALVEVNTLSGEHIDEMVAKAISQ